MSEETTTPSVTEQAVAEMQDEKRALRVLEAKHLLRHIDRLKREMFEAHERLHDLDNGAEPREHDPVTGDRYRIR